MCPSVGAPRAWSEGLACGCWMSHSGRIAVGSGGWSEGLLGGHQLGHTDGVAGVRGAWSRGLSEWCPSGLC